jgi:hypothetical protein
MKFMTSTLAIAATLAAGPAAAHSRAACTAAVLQGALIPSAPYGFWLVSATLELRSSHAPPSTVNIRETLPWQMTLRRGEVFRIPCEYASGNGLSLAALASAPSFRSFAARSGYARLR